MLDDAWEVPVLQEHEGLCCLAFSPNGKALATGSSDGSIRLWDIASRELVATYKAELFPEENFYDTALLCLTFAPDGTRVYAGTEEGYIIAWDFAAHQAKWLWHGFSECRGIAQTRFENSITIWASESRRWLATLGSSEIIRLHPETNAYLDRVDLIGIYPGGNPGEIYVTSVVFSLDGRIAVICYCSLHVLIWDMFLSRRVDFIENARVQSLAVTSDSGHIALAYAGRIDVWSVAERRYCKTFEFPTYFSATPSIAFFCNDQRLALANDGCLSYWDLQSGSAGTLLASNDLGEHYVDRCELSISQSGLIAASSVPGGYFVLWDLAENRAFLPPMGKHIAPVACVAYSPDGHLVATGSLDCTIKVWSRSSRAEIASLGDYGRPIDEVCFTESSKGIVAIRSNWMNQDIRNRRIEVWSLYPEPEIVFETSVGDDWGDLGGDMCFACDGEFLSYANPN